LSKLVYVRFAQNFDTHKSSPTLFYGQTHKIGIFNLKLTRIEYKCGKESAKDVLNPLIFIGKDVYLRKINPST
jgi:hypothetical protein